MRTHSPEVYWLSAALPPRIREPTLAYLAFQGSLTDMVNEREVSATTIADLSARVRAATSGAPSAEPIDRALSRAAADHALSPALLEALLEALIWEVEGRRFATYEGLLDACVRRRGTTAMAISTFMGRRKRVVLERAADLGVAIELTLVARDVAADARRGRVRLPLEWLEEAGVDPDRIVEAPRGAPGLDAVVVRLARAADGFYRRSDPGIAALPFDCRPAVRCARYAFRALGAAIERGEESPSPSIPHLARLAARALRASRSEARPLAAPPLREARELVAAIAADE